MNRDDIRLILWLCCLLTAIASYAQRQADSLIGVAAQESDSIERCRIYLSISQLYGQTKPSVASLYKQKAAELAAQISDDKQLPLQLMFAKHYIQAQAFGESRQYVEKARTLAKPGDLKNQAMIAYYTASICFSEGKTKEALDHYIRSYKVADAMGNRELQAHINSAFGVIYQHQNMLDSALVYYRKSFAHFEHSNNEYTMTLLLNIGNVLMAQGAFAEGQSYLKRALELAKTRGDMPSEMIILGNIANGYEREKRLDLADEYARELVKEAEQVGYPLQILYGKILLGTVELDRMQYAKAIRSAEEALALAKASGISSFDVTLYEMLMKAYELKGDYKQAYTFKNKLTRLNDSLAAVQNNSYIEEIKQKYQLQQKNQELLLKTELIAQIKKADRQKTLIIAFLLLIGLSGIVSLFLFIQRRRIREELARKSLIFEHQSKNFEAFINGQEEERKRIASDLHDGLGQHLVMLKMGIQHLQLPNQHEQQHLEQEIDSMIEETRKISHNMMPGVLVDLGLLKALRSLVADINAHHPELTVSLQTTDTTETLTGDTEIQVYRIVQELLNNIIRHSEATSCEIQLVSGSGKVSVEVRDNGRGFDIRSVKNGIGLRNIRSRADSIQGRLSVDSAPGKGTRVKLEFTVK